MTTRTFLRVSLMLLIGAAAAILQPVSAQSPAGTWQIYPAQTSSNTTTVQQPINADGTSNFKSNGKAVIPVKFSLSTALGPVIFQSIGSDAATDNDYSFASFAPTSPLTFSAIESLSAVYNFTTGDCHGGSLRWQVRTSGTQAVYIYYGVDPNFGNGAIGGCNGPVVSVGGVNQSGLNLKTEAGLRFDLQQYGGPFYGSYADALAYVGTLPIVRASLVLDSGWLGDQELVLTNATVNNNTFTPSTSVGATTCDLPAATIQITKLSGSSSGDVNEPISIQPNDNNAQFRIVDCKYIYNLATSSLSGPGKYQVTAVINGSPAIGAATFDLK